MIDDEDLKRWTIWGLLMALMLIGTHVWGI